MDRTFVSQVESNLKGGCKTALGEKTLIVGPNGAGKSTITQAVELALTGTVSDVAGRAAVAKDGDLVALLAPPGADRLFAEIALSTGSGAKWEGVAGKRAAHALFSGVDKTTVLPLRAVREALLGSPETGRKWILGMAGGEHAALVLKLEQARKRARDERSRAQTLRASATAQAAGLPAPGSVVVPKADAAARVALADVEARLLAAEEALAEAEAALRAQPPLPAQPALQITKVGAAILAVLDGQIAAGASKCGVCGGEAPLDAARARHRVVSEKIQGALDAAGAWSRQKADLDALRLDYGAAQAEVERLLAERARFTAIRDEHAAAPDAETAALAARWEQVRKLEGEAKDAEVAAASAEADATSFAADLSRATNAARDAFEASVQRFLPAGDTFGLDLLDGEREVFRVGLRRQGKLHAALSGAEWARVVAAIASACLPATGPAVVIPEERAFDPATLAGVLRAFDAVPAQVIVTSPVAPSAVPAGWTVIEVGAPGAAGEQPASVAVQAAGEIDLFGDNGGTEPTAAAPNEIEALPPPEKKARKPRKDKGQKRGAAGATTSPPTQAVAGASVAARGEPGWCEACHATVVIGSCEHGIQAPAKPPRTAVDDLFD